MTRNIDIVTALGLPTPPSNSPDTVAALLWAREVMQQHITATYAVTDPEGIEELKPVTLGGVQQWLHIRGRKRDNPVLLWLHGGPGSPIIGCADAGQRPWEDYFTVVQWDQRQTGKSYYPAAADNAPLTVQQFIEDTEELVAYLRDYFKQDKLFVLGASWGTVLGMHMVKRHPDWLHAYVGVGQVVDSSRATRAIYERLISHAQTHNDRALEAKVSALLPLLEADYPEREKAFVDNALFARKELSRLAGEALMHHMLWDDVGKMFALERTLSPHLSLTDLSNAILGDGMAVFRPPYTFTRDLLSNDLPKDIGSDFEVPIFFFTGAHDWQTPVTLSDQWFQEICAPHKELIHFTESSHCVVNEEPGKFLVALVNKVLPFAQSGVLDTTESTAVEAAPKQDREHA